MASPLVTIRKPTRWAAVVAANEYRTHDEVITCVVQLVPLFSVYWMSPVPVTRRSQTLKVREAEVPIAAELMIVPLPALAVIRSAVASLRGLVLFVLVRVRFVSAQLLFVPPEVSKLSL